MPLLLYAVLRGKAQHSDSCTAARSARKLHSMCAWQVCVQGWTLSLLDTLPPGLALPLLEGLQRCRSSPPQGAHSRTDVTDTLHLVVVAPLV